MGKTASCVCRRAFSLPEGARGNGACPVPSCSHIMGLRVLGFLPSHVRFHYMGPRTDERRESGGGGYYYPAEGRPVKCVGFGIHVARNLDCQTEKG